MGVLKLGFVLERVKLLVVRTPVSLNFPLLPPREPSNSRIGEVTDRTSLLLILHSVLGFLLLLHMCVWLYFFLRWLCGIVIEDEQIQKSAWTALKAV